ncbi:hypothetical protein ACFQ1S_31745, partial [Kibdelosporangium lantanae]
CVRCSANTVPPPGFPGFPSAMVRSWDGYVPAEGHSPTLRRPDSPQWTVQCDYDNSGSIKVDTNGAGSTDPEGGYLIITVVWAKDGKADPTSNDGAQAKSWGDKSGFLLPQPDDPRFGQLCMSSVKLATGSGVTLVSNSRFKSQTSACAIADASAAAIGAMSH